MKWINGKVILLVMMLLFSVACSNTNQASNDSHEENVVVASTSWTGAITKAAGADNIAIIAPADLKHPAEYDVRPSDMAKMRKAKFVVYSEYDPFMNDLIRSAQVPKKQTIFIRPDNDPENLKKQARAIAAKIGTSGKEKKWEQKFDQIIKEINIKLKNQNLVGKRVVIQTYMKPIVQTFGLKIVGEYGPHEVTPSQIVKLSNLKPDMIIENIHMPQGKGIANLSKSPYIKFFNYPSATQQSIEELFISNSDLLLKR